MLSLMVAVAVADPGFYAGISLEEAEGRAAAYEVALEGWVDAEDRAVATVGGSPFPQCPTPLTVEELRASLVSVDRHILITGDSAAAVATLDGLDARLPCLEEPVATADLASVPFLRAAAAGTLGAIERVDAALAATWAVDPEFEHPNYDATAMRAAAGRLAPQVPVPIDWWLGEGETAYVDGRPMPAAFVRPGRHLVQIVSPSGVRGAWFDARQPVTIRTEAGLIDAAARLDAGATLSEDLVPLFDGERPFVLVTPDSVLRWDGQVLSTPALRPLPPVVTRRRPRVAWLAAGSGALVLGAAGAIASSFAYGRAVEDATTAQHAEAALGVEGAAALWADANQRARAARSENLLSYTLLGSGVVVLGVTVALPGRVPVEPPVPLVP